MSTQIPVDELTHDELRDLEALGAVKDGVATVGPPDPPKITPEQAVQLPPTAIPAMPDGVKERLTSVKQIESSFSLREGDKVVAESQDRGKAAEHATTPDNPDWKGKPVEPIVDFEDRARFLASMLGSRPFTKIYRTFGDVEVAFRTRTGEQEFECARQARDDEPTYINPSDTADQKAAARAGRYTFYQFAASLTEIRVPGDTPRVFDAFKAFGPGGRPGVLADAQRELLRLPAPFLRQLRQLYFGFERLVGQLTDAADQPDFWRVGSAT